MTIQYLKYKLTIALLLFICFKLVISTLLIKTYTNQHLIYKYKFWNFMYISIYYLNSKKDYM